MKRFRPTWILLTLALVAGQWAALAHSAEHTTLQPHDGVCVLCIQGQNLDDAPTHGQTVPEAGHHVDITPQTRQLATCDHAETRPAIRAPPHSIL